MATNKTIKKKKQKNKLKQGNCSLCGKKLPRPLVGIKKMDTDDIEILSSDNLSVEEVSKILEQIELNERYELTFGSRCKHCGAISKEVKSYLTFDEMMESH